MTSDAAAHVLFPNDRPATTRQPLAPSIAPAVTTPDTGKVVSPRSPADTAKSDAAGVFPTEVRPDERDSAVVRLDTLADAVRLGGDADRADALVEAGSILAAEAQSHGMPSADLQEIIGYVHDASSTVSEMTSDQLADGMAKGLRELAEVPAADLDLARGLIRQMSEKMPSLPYQLEATGLGNRPDFIRAVIREAKRRGVR